VIFDCVLFDELRRADPAHGAKHVVRAHAAQIRDVDVDDEGAFVDIDTPEDYARHASRMT
jgi:CTP:molybdopterin cytidylyltransferase MocA